MLDPHENEKAEMPVLTDKDSIDHAQVAANQERIPESSITSKFETDRSTSFISSITASSPMSGKEVLSPWKIITILAVSIFWMQSIFVWMMPKYFRRCSLFFRLAKDIFICILIHPVTGCKFTERHRKHGLHLIIPNILTVGRVVYWVMMLITSIERCYTNNSNADTLTDFIHMFRHTTFNIQNFFIYPIWTYYLKHKHTAAEKFVGFIVFSYFFADLIGNIAASLNGVPNLNSFFILALKSRKTPDNSSARIFLGVVLQTVMMSRWNLCWIFCDIMLDTDFHRHTRHEYSIRESSGVGLKSPVLLGTWDMSEDNTVEVWIIGI